MLPFACYRFTISRFSRLVTAHDRERIDMIDSSLVIVQIMVYVQYAQYVRSVSCIQYAQYVRVVRYAQHVQCLRYVQYLLPNIPNQTKYYKNLTSSCPV